MRGFAALHAAAGGAGIAAKWRERKLWDRPWPTDGVVVKVIDREVQFQMGESSRAPWWALACK
ncbi:MAG: hypothetical protein EBR00_11220 [Gammaproteobacteria bacterium]|nr:hypothetical protein [Gammaproteobacteria bacterium]